MTYRPEPLPVRWERIAESRRAFMRSLPARIGRNLTDDEREVLAGAARVYDDCARELREARDRGEL